MLYNVLPQAVAARLRAGEAVADSFSDLTAIFVDLAGFSILTKRLSPGHLVEITGMSRFHLCRVFRRTTGVPPYEYYKQLRLARARDLLHEGVGIAAAACRVGYSDQSHLTRHFKRYVATTPGAYARAARQARDMARENDTDFSVTLMRR